MNFLLSRGHSFQHIQAYTPGQLGIFIKEATKQKEASDKTDIVNAWIAHNADQKWINKNVIKVKATPITDNPLMMAKVIKVKRERPKKDS